MTIIYDLLLVAPIVIGSIIGWEIGRWITRKIKDRK